MPADACRVDPATPCHRSETRGRQVLRRLADTLLTLAVLVGLPAVAGEAASEAAPSELESRVKAMAKIRGAFSPSFSPDGERLAFVSDLSGLPQVWSVSASGGWPSLVTDLDDQVGGVGWSPTKDLLAFTVAPGGGLNQQIFLVKPDGSGLQRITAGGRETNFVAGWGREGERLYYTSSVADPAALDSYVFRLGEDEGRLLDASPGLQRTVDVSRDRRWAVIWRMASRSDSNLVLKDLETPARGGVEVLLTPHEGPGNFGGGYFSADGSSVYLISDQGRDLAALGRVRLTPTGQASGEDAPQSAPTAGAIEVLAERADAELENLVVSRDGSTALLEWNVAGRNEISFYDLASGEETLGPELPGDLVGGATFSPDGRRLAMVLSGANLPADIWVLERATGELTQVTHSAHPGIDLTSLVRPELVRYRAHDDLELSGWLYRPPGVEEPAPYVLSFHGGPEGQERPGFNSTYQALLGRGIGVFAPNVRGSSGFGKRFVNLDNGALRKNGVRDIESTAAYITGAGIADEEALGIMGGSYGGYMTMAGLAWYPETFAAGANLFGVVNFETFFENTEPWMAAVSTVEYGDPETQAEMLRDLSPIHAVDQVKAPTLVLHGANDTNVPVVEAEQVVESLEAREVPVRYVLFPDEGHGFRKIPNRITSTVAIVEWFDRYLNAGARTGGN